MDTFPRGAGWPRLTDGRHSVCYLQYGNEFRHTVVQRPFGVAITDLGNLMHQCDTLLLSGTRSRADAASDPKYESRAYHAPSSKQRRQVGIREGSGDLITG